MITPVEHSDWATPVVPVNKKDGSGRLCGDFKVTLNSQLCVDKYPVPRIEDLFASLAGGQHFSKLDLANAYLQMEVEEESKKLLTISTQKGLLFQSLAFWSGIVTCIVSEGYGSSASRPTIHPLLSG